MSETKESTSKKGTPQQIKDINKQLKEQIINLRESIRRNSELLNYRVDTDRSDIGIKELSDHINEQENLLESTIAELKSAGDDTSVDLFFHIKKLKNTQMRDFYTMNAEIANQLATFERFPFSAKQTEELLNRLVDSLLLIIIIQFYFSIKYAGPTTLKYLSLTIKHLSRFIAKLLLPFLPSIGSEFIDQIIGIIGSIQSKNPIDVHVINDIEKNIRDNFVIPSDVYRESETSLTSHDSRRFIEGSETTAKKMVEKDRANIDAVLQRVGNPPTRESRGPSRGPSRGRSRSPSRGTSRGPIRGRSPSRSRSRSRDKKRPSTAGGKSRRTKTRKNKH